MKLALAGDTMLGRGVAEALRTRSPADLFDEAVVAAAHEADLFVLNLECAVSERGQRWPDPRKPFFFRAPPRSLEALQLLGVDCVTLANNHALDYGAEALLDTLDHLDAVGIAHVGAGADVFDARAPVVVEGGGLRFGVVGATDHPAAFAAGRDRPGVAYGTLRDGVPSWELEAVGRLAADAAVDVVVVTPHWGPNMVTEPLREVRVAAQQLLDAGATLVAGHSAHVFHGVADRVLYDLGDFIDDYAVDPRLRNDLGLLWLVTFEGPRPVRVEAVPLALDFAHTRAARPPEAEWIGRRLRAACASFGTEVHEHDGRLVIDRS